MPELPEVETIRRGLAATVIGARIARVQVSEPRLRRRVDVRRLAGLAGRTIGGVDRRAKYLLIHVGDGLTWLVHLGMSGRFLLVPDAEPPGAHEHVRVWLGDGRALAFRDPRRFGWMRLGPLAELDELAALGPEPLSDEFGF